MQPCRVEDLDFSTQLPFDGRIRPGKRPVDEVDVVGGPEAFTQILVLEHLGELSQNLDVLVSGCGQTDHQMSHSRAPIDAVGILSHDYAGAEDGVLRLEGAVRQRHTVAEVGGCRLLAVLHSVDVGRRGETSTDQLASYEVDRCFHRFGRPPEEHCVAGENRLLACVTHHSEEMISSPAARRSTTPSTAGSLKNIVNGTTAAPGACSRARRARPL